MKTMMHNQLNIRTNFLWPHIVTKKFIIYLIWICIVIESVLGTPPLMTIPSVEPPPVHSFKPPPRYNGSFITNNTVIEAIPGQSTKLPCLIPSELVGTKVSWMRRRDFQLLSVGESMYANDNRFFVSHSRHSHYQGSRHTQVWFLHLLNITDSDRGAYVCQTSNHPYVSTITFLKVRSAYSIIEGPKERVVAAHSNLKLVCSLKNSSQQLAYLFWYRGTRMINFDENERVTVETGTDYSALTIESIRFSQAGNYTCEPSNARSSFVIVHVVEEMSNSRGYDANRDGIGNSFSGVFDSSSNKTSVLQLGVKSASSAGSFIHEKKGIIFILISLLSLFLKHTKI